MRRWILSALLLITMMLGGCGGNRSGLESRISASDPAALRAKDKAMVVLSTGAEMAGALFTANPAVSLYWTAKGPDGRPDIMKGFVVEGRGSDAPPQIREIAPGTYILATFSFGSYSNSGGLTGLAPATFTVNAGDVLYLGHMKIVTEKSGIFASAKLGYTIEVQSKEAGARALMQSEHPGLAAALQSRFVIVNPLVASR
jgi:hypothetical protein